MMYSADSKERRITQLRKGILGLAVMRVLYHQQHYGYSLFQVFSKTRSTSIKECTIYPILTHLDREGLVHSEWVESGQGAPRKYYSLTSSGRQLFDELSQEFDLWASLVQQKVPNHSEHLGKKVMVQKSKTK